MVKVNAVEELPPKLLRKKKILVTALAGMLCDLEMTEPEEPEQPELPLMKNNDQRKAWLRDYKSWGCGMQMSISGPGTTSMILRMGQG